MEEVRQMTSTKLFFTFYKGMKNFFNENDERVETALEKSNEIHTWFRAYINARYENKTEEK